jgi:HAD superfamily phosphoserine phosphatase-like hydrolase
MKDIRLICFDLDETITTSNSWGHFNRSLGVSVEEDRQLYDQYITGGITYDEWTARLVEIYLKCGSPTRESIRKILSEYSFVEGARETVDYLRARGYELVLISGSIDMLVDVVGRDLGISHSKAHNSLVFDDAGNLVTIH